MGAAITLFGTIAMWSELTMSPEARALQNFNSGNEYLSDPLSTPLVCAAFAIGGVWLIAQLWWPRNDHLYKQLGGGMLAVILVVRILFRERNPNVTCEDFYAGEGAREAYCERLPYP